jgi:ankyrin repeat protein
MMRRMMTGAAVAAALTLTGCGMPAADTPLTKAAQSGDITAAKALLAQGTDPDARDSFGMTPLVRAARRGDAGMVDLLLAGHADPNVPDAIRSREGWSPLLNAVHKNQIEIVRRLLRAGADVNARTPGGNSALAMAAGDGGVEMVRLLLEAGADPRPGRGGSLALTNAVACGRADNVRLLLGRAPDLTMERGLRSDVAFALAKVSRHTDVLDQLEHRQKPSAALTERTQ